MIIPLPEPIKNFDRAPMVWTLLALNVFIYVLIFSSSSKQFMQDQFIESDSLQVTGRLYYQYYQKHKTHADQFPDWVHSSSFASKEKLEVLGVFALRDKNFLQNYQNMQFYGDEIEISRWKKNVEKYKTDLSKQMLFRFGLSPNQVKGVSWLTYQFSHAGWLHLFSNMVFLLFIGFAVESLVGSSLFLMIYLLGGFAGGFLFLMLNLNILVPMVGASASISALLAFYVFYERKKNIPYVFLLRPFKEKQGEIDYIYLPRLLIIPMFLISDVSGLLSSPSGLGGSVAYSAHVGGALMGIILAYLFKLNVFGALNEDKGLR